MPEDEEVVILLDVLPEDLPILFEYQRQPAANAMAAFPARDWDTFVAHWAKISKDENNITRAVVLQGEVAGNIGSWEQDGRREIGYWIARAHWGQGYATEAGLQLIEIARTLGLPRLEAAHFIDNPASGRVLEKLGFCATGRTAPRNSCARNAAQLCKLFTLELASEEKMLAA